MRIGSAWKVLRGQLALEPGLIALILFALSLCSIILTLTAAIVVGVPRGVFAEIEKAFPATRLLVESKGAEIAIFKLDQGIDETRLAKLSNLPGVTAAYPIEPLRIPSSLRGGIMDFELQTDVVVWGVPPEMVELSHAHPEKPFESTNWRRGEQLRFVVPGFYLDMYNGGLAVSGGLPKVSAGAAIGREVTLLAGSSTISMGANPDKKQRLKGEVIGLTSQADLLGVLLPLESVQTLNRWYLGGAYVPQYVRVQVQMEDIAYYDGIVDEIEKMGLRIHGNRDTVELVRGATLAGAAICLFFSFIVCGLLFFLIGTLFSLRFRAQRGEIALLRASGIPMRGIWKIFCAEAILLGGSAGLLFGAATTVALRFGEAALLAALPEFSFLPDAILWLPYYLPLLIGLAVTALSMLVVQFHLLPAMFRQPAHLLRSWG